MKRPFYLSSRSGYWYYRLNKASGIVDEDDLQCGNDVCRERAPNGWKASHEVATDDPGDLGFEPLSASETVEVDADCRKQAWARLLAKVYEIDPLVCPKCGSEMKAIAAWIRSHFVKLANTTIS